MAVSDIPLYDFAAQLGQGLHWGNLEKRRVSELMINNFNLVCLNLDILFLEDARCYISLTIVTFS